MPTKDAYDVPLHVGRWPVLAVLGLLIVVRLLTQFEVRAYGIPATALTIAFVVQAMPWGREPKSEAG